MSTSYISVCELESRHALPDTSASSSENGAAVHRQVFYDRQLARNAGYRSSWEWRRNYRKVAKAPNSEAVLFVLGDKATPEELHLYGGLHGLMKTVHDGRMIQRKVPLYRLDQTRPYQPTTRTEAIWKFGDILVRNRERYALRVNGGGWHRYEVKGDVRLLLTDTALGNHCRGKQTVGVFAEDHTEFLVVRVNSLEDAEALASSFGELQTNLSSRKAFLEVGPDGFEMWFVLKGAWKTHKARKRLEALLRRYRIVAEVFPHPNTPIWLPLAASKTTFTDQVDLTGDVVAFSKWLRHGNHVNLAEALDHFRLQRMEERVSQIVQPIELGSPKPKRSGDALVGMGLLSIPYQNEYLTNNSPLKNRCWQQVTSFWKGEPSGLDLDRALIISSRLLSFEGVLQEEAEELLLAYAEAIPNPTSSRLVDPRKRNLLLKDVRKSVQRAYEGNGRQEDSETSTAILSNVVKVWQAKSLKLSDKATWGNVEGYLAVPQEDITFTKDEIDALQGRLGGVLSKRDLQGRELREAVRGLATAVVRLVAAKESETLAVSYWSKYLKAETGMNLGNRNKMIKVRNAFRDCGLIRILKKGTEGCGATRYGLGVKVADRMSRPVLISSEDLAENWDEMVHKVVSPMEKQLEEIEEAMEEAERVSPMGLLSIPYQNHKSIINSPHEGPKPETREARRKRIEKEKQEWEQFMKEEGFW